MSESSDASSGSIPLSGIVAEDSPAPTRASLAGARSLGLVDVEEPDAEDQAADEEARRERRREARSSRPRRTWRQGGSSVQRWGWELVGWAVLALGAGVLGATAVTEFVPGELGGVLSQVVLWVAFAVPVVLGFARSRPRGLLRFRPVDVLYAVAFGGMLRLAQGWLEVRAGGSGAWPSYPSLGGGLPSGWFFDELLTAVVVAPVLEEFFFRGLLLVALYTAIRRMAGSDVAHALLAPLAWDAVVSLALVGLTASLLVLLTGRIWAAVLVHVVYNGLFVAMATVGTLLA